MSNLRRHQNGFTIVELMIATAVFSVVLMICAVAIVQIGRMFYKGIITGRTQDVARKVVNDVSQAIQYTGQMPVKGLESRGGIDVNYICAGGVRYSYSEVHSLGTGPGQIPHVLWRDRYSGVCEAADINQSGDPTAGGEELLSTDMRVPNFDINTVGQITTIDLTVSYGATTDLYRDASLAACINSDVGGQFCAISKLTTTVKKRL